MTGNCGPNAPRLVGAAEFECGIGNVFLEESASMCYLYHRT